jgi:hypothetical protein
MNNRDRRTTSGRVAHKTDPSTGRIAAMPPESASSAPPPSSTSASSGSAWFRDAAVVAEHPFHIEADLARDVTESTIALLMKLRASDKQKK